MATREDTSTGLVTVEAMTARVANWKRHNRCHAERISRVRLVDADEEMIAEWSMEDFQPSEVGQAMADAAAAAGAPVTGCLYAMDANGVTVARQRWRALPLRERVDQVDDRAPPALDIARVCIDALREQTKVSAQFLQSMEGMVKSLATMHADAATLANARNITLQDEADQARALMREALDIARGQGKVGGTGPARGGAGEAMLMDVLKGAVRQLAGLPEAPEPEAPKLNAGGGNAE